jgi:hypothetical protein
MTIAPSDQQIVQEEQQPTPLPPLPSTPIPTPPAAYKTLPAELFFWVTLTRDDVRGGGKLSYRAERLLPVNVDTLHQTWQRLANGGWVMMGIEPQRLQLALQQHPDLTESIWSVIPDRIPGHLPTEIEAIRPQLNCLHGQFEPAPRQRLNRLIKQVLIIGLSSAAFFALIGMERQRSALFVQAEAVNKRLQQRLESSLPGDPTIPADQRLIMELRRLEASTAVVSPSGTDAARMTQNIIGRLPRDTRYQVEALTISDERISLRVRLVDLSVAEKLHRALVELSTTDLRIQPLQAQQLDGYAMAVIDFQRRTSP